MFFKKYSIMVCLFIWGAIYNLAQADTITSVGQKAMPAVVSIAVLSSVNDEDALKNRIALMFLAPRKDIFGHEILNAPRKVGSLGSGFVIYSRGKPYIVTNYHTVENAIKIKVTFFDDSILNATLMGYDAGTDLAVLEVDTKRTLTALTWADSKKIKLGQRAIALGNSYGLGPTLTAGVVSSPGRDLSDPSLGFTSSQLINKFIQTDASINKGNSGGPLVNEAGEVIGVNFAILTSSGGSDGVGLAIPANMAKKVVQNIIDFGRVKRAWLGISVQGITKEIADNLNLKKMEGALVISATDNGPAKQAGIKSRDVILRINDIPIKDTTDVSRTIGQLAVGEVINIDAWRDGTHKQFKAKLQEFQSQEDYRTTIKTSKNVLKDHIKLENYDMGITPLTWQFRQRYNAENPTIQGVLVSDVKEGGWAEKNGILTGDIVLEINGQPITSTETLKEKMDQEARLKKPLLLFLYRMGQKLYVGLRPKPEATVNRK